VIFVTVGTQLPFERLVRAIDAWAEKHPEQEVVMQSGDSNYLPQHCKAIPFTQPEEWEALFDRAELIVSHAGMGTILKCLDRGKPLIIMPRLGSLGEHRNDHQVATAKRFSHIAAIRIVQNDDELFDALEKPYDISSSQDNNPANLNQLVSALREFILQE